MLLTSSPPVLQEVLSSTQLAYLESYRQCLLAQRQTELQDRIKTAIQDAGDTIPDRSVTPLQKIR